MLSREYLTLASNAREAKLEQVVVTKFSHQSSVEVFLARGTSTARAGRTGAKTQGKIERWFRTYDQEHARKIRAALEIYFNNVPNVMA